MVTNNKKKKIKKEKLYSQLASIPFYIIITLFIALPLIMVILYSFQKNPDDGLFQLDFTLKNYSTFFGYKYYVRIMGQSIYFALITTLVTLLIGYPLAYFISIQKARLQSILLILTTAPMWINMLIRTLALKQIFQLVDSSILGTRFAVISGMVYIFLPFMVVPIYAILAKIDKNLYHAANDLGANRFKTFVKVTLPLSKSGVFSGILMVFLPSATSLVVPAYLGEGKMLIGNVIEAFAKTNGNIGVASAITIVLSILMLAMVALLGINKKKRRYKIDYEIVG